MHPVRFIRKLEQGFDSRIERFLWHHPVLGLLYLFVGLPLVVLLCVCMITVMTAFPILRLMGWL